MNHIAKKLLDACVGHPDAKIEWPHRILHEGIEEIERLEGIRGKIGRELYVAAEALGASPDLLAIIGSYGDTLSDEDVLSAMRLYNESGKALIESKDRH